MTVATLNSALESAARALPNNVIVTKHGTPQEGYSRLSGISGKAGSVGSIRLNETVPLLRESQTRINNLPAGEEISVARRVLENARVSQAGARLVTVESAPAPGGPTSSWTRAGSFTLIEPATFAEGDEVSPIAPSALPVSSADIDLSVMPSYGVRFEIARSTQKSLYPGELDARMVNAIVMGVANAVDQIVLTEIAAKLLEAGGGSAMPTYTLAKAAAKGLRFDELRGIVGTTGTGATLENGVLRVSGIPSELSDQTADTFVGAFDRSAIAVMDEIRVLIERIDVNGKMAVTCWLDAMPLVPDAGFFWSVA